MFGNAGIFSQASAPEVSLVGQAIDLGTYFSPAQVSGITGYAAGDTMFAFVNTPSGASSQALQSGWSIIENQSEFRVYQRTLGASDNPNNFTFRPTTFVSCILAAFVVREANVITSNSYSQTTDYNLSVSGPSANPMLVIVGGGRVDDDTDEPDFGAAYNDLYIEDAAKGYHLRAGSNLVTTGSPPTITADTTFSRTVKSAIIVCEGS